MLKHKAEGILSNLDVSRPWSSRLEFIEALAALAKVHRDEMLRKIPGPNRFGCSILSSQRVLSKPRRVVPQQRASKTLASLQVSYSLAVRDHFK
jgi:hypothetical protein